jgi:hypothetical protein
MKKAVVFRRRGSSGGSGGLLDARRGGSGISACEQRLGRILKSYLNGCILFGTLGWEVLLALGMRRHCGKDKNENGGTAGHGIVPHNL